MACEHLLLGMSTAVLDVDAVESDLEIDLAAKEIQQKIERRAPIPRGVRPRPVRDRRQRAVTGDVVEPSTVVERLFDHLAETSIPFSRFSSR